MDNQLKRFNLNATYITDYDKEDLIHEDIIKYVKSYKKDGNNTYPIKLSEVSLILKHMHIYEIMIKENIPEVIVFEDDVTLNENFDIKFTNYYKQLPHDWDIFYFGSGWNLHVPNKVVNENGGNVFLKGNNGIGLWSPEVKDDGWPVCGGSTRCTDSYLINKKAAEKILKYYRAYKFNFPLDLNLNMCYRTLNFKSYWGEPTICDPNTFVSSIKNSN